MLEVISKYIKDVSVLRRILFAASVLPPQLPQFWGVVVEFATLGNVSAQSVTPEQARVFIENLHVLNAKAFDTDETLFQELLQSEIPAARPLGIPLISTNNTCLVCGSNLLLRKDVLLPLWCMTAFVGPYLHHTSTNTVLAGHALLFNTMVIIRQETVDRVQLLTTSIGIHFLILSPLRKLVFQWTC